MVQQPFQFALVSKNLFTLCLNFTNIMIIFSTYWWLLSKLYY